MVIDSDTAAGTTEVGGDTFAVIAGSGQDGVVVNRAQPSAALGKNCVRASAAGGDVITVIYCYMLPFDVPWMP